jgi:hypothetical protein
MSTRTQIPWQPPLPPFKREVDAMMRAALEAKQALLAHRRGLARKRSRRYRAQKAGQH